MSIQYEAEVREAIRKVDFNRILKDEIIARGLWFSLINANFNRILKDQLTRVHSD